MPSREIPDPMPALHDALGALDAALAIWAARDDSKVQPEVTRAVRRAVDAIDAILRDLYLVRGRLASEIRQADDAAMKRTDELLARVRPADALAERAMDVIDRAVHEGKLPG